MLTMPTPLSSLSAPRNPWVFAITPGRAVGVLAELVGAVLPFAGCYLAFTGRPHLGIEVGAVGLMATAGLIVQAERRRGDPMASIWRDAQAFRHTPDLAQTQRAYDQRPHA
jgi:hypothetical protein